MDLHVVSLNLYVHVSSTVSNMSQTECYQVPYLVSGKCFGKPSLMKPSKIVPVQVHCIALYLVLYGKVVDCTAVRFCTIKSRYRTRQHSSLNFSKTQSLLCARRINERVKKFYAKPTTRKQFFVTPPPPPQGKVSGIGIWDTDEINNSSKMSPKSSVIPYFYNYNTVGTSTVRTSVCSAKTFSRHLCVTLFSSFNFQYYVPLPE